MTVWPPKYDCKLQKCYCRKKTIYVHQINNDQHVQKVVPANFILYTVYTMTSSQKRSQLVNNLRLHTVHSVHNDPPPTCTGSGPNIYHQREKYCSQCWMYTVTFAGGGADCGEQPNGLQWSAGEGVQCLILQPSRQRFQSASHASGKWQFDKYARFS